MVKDRILTVLDTIDGASVGQLARVIDGSHSLIRASVAELLEAGDVTRQAQPIARSRKRGPQERYVYRLADL